MQGISQRIGLCIRTAGLFAATGVVASALVAAATVAPAAAKQTCTKLGFTVNDYGKEGPTNDAKNLLDKYIAEWTAQHGIKKYKTGPKDVTCELFLDVIIFDEHTCKATASVCWSGPPYTVPGKEAEAGETKPKKPS